MKFGAPWATSVKWITILTVSVLICLVIFGVTRIERVSSASDFILFPMVVVLPALLLFTSVFLMIRGYVITDEQLLIQRLGWQSRLDLKNLVSVEVNPEAMARSIQTFAVGGLFCYYGSFRNKNLGAYRAFATDSKRSVVLKYQHQTVVVTPDRPDECTARIKERIAIL